jgi:hypothetical protein
VLVFGWSLPQILLIYWIETAVVGVIGALKIRAAIDLGGAGSDAPPVARRRVRGPHVSVVEERLGPVPHRGSGGGAYALIWLAVYLVFWAILGTIVIQIVNGGFYEGASTTGFSGVPLGMVVGGTLSLVIGHLFAYYRDYIRGERYLTDSLLSLSRPPFARPIVLLGAIAVGGVGTALIGAPVGFLVAMVLAKTAIELWWARSAPTAEPTRTGESVTTAQPAPSGRVGPPTDGRPG